MKMGVIRLEIRVESGNYKTIQIFGNMEIQKNPKKWAFSIILPEILCPIPKISKFWNVKFNFK
jgi:hypothetical protein